MIDDEEMKKQIGNDIQMVKNDIEANVKALFDLKDELTILKKSLICDHDFSIRHKNSLWNSLECSKCGYEVDE